MVSVDPLDWVKSTVFYQIFPDRFARGQAESRGLNLEPWDSPATLHGFKGGDLKGICHKLDYLKDVGFNGIYLNPIFSSTANHRYHTYDYFQIDPILGDEESFLELLKECKKKGIRVLLDGVFNHASRGFYQFNHTLENGRNSPFKDWFHFNPTWLDSGKQIDAYCSEPRRYSAPQAETSFDLYGYRAWWDIPALPKFNTNNQDVRDFLWGVAEHWIKYGIDGWRLDVPSEIDDDSFWREFRRRVKGINQEAYIIGEIWGDASRWLSGDQFDGVTNYPLGKILMGFCLKDTLNYPEIERSGLKHMLPFNAHECHRELVNLFSKYPKDAVFHQLNFLTSHDTPRLMTIASGDVEGICLLWTALITMPGTPCIYYGEEIGMAGGHDPDCRRGFEWDSNLWNQGLKHHIKKLINLRLSIESLQKGEFEMIHVDSDQIIYRRQFGHSVTVIGVNVAKVSYQSTVLDVPWDISHRDRSDLWPDHCQGNEPLRVKIKVKEGGSHPLLADLMINLKPRSAAIWSSF
jgi:cyclomaltodextrinase